uniref:STI1 domain-containing protein n=1 Tax=Erythrolobus madagascarensis TaxID=708628 RepID=A0A7S0T8X4_9RHOD|mmetsp:Transcript_249/g.445  ORF Transcript_249/g.445 Transcript_249/m.445 type:complete len:514 (+) Transcript_249:47-1588(+)
MQDGDVRLALGVLRRLRNANHARSGDACDAISKCLSDVYGVDLASEDIKSRYGYTNVRDDQVPDAMDIFCAGERALDLQPKDASTTAPSSASVNGVDDVDAASAKYEQEFQKFIATLKRTPFFAGVEEGSAAYTDRVAKARTKFEAKYGPPPAPSTNNGVGLDSTGSRGLDASAQSGESADAKAIAEEFKQKGNEALKAEQFQEALTLYTKAIEADRTNAVYYSNRAAAKIHLEKYTSAIDDCKKAISLDSSYLRARERLATAYRHCQMIEEEIEALQDALAIDPDNVKLQSELDSALRRQAGVEDPTDASGSQQQLPQMPPGMPDLGGLLNNPMMAQMASQMMSNPNIQQMMSDPNIMQQAMSMFGGAGGAGAGAGAGFAGGNPQASRTSSNPSQSTTATRSASNEADTTTREAATTGLNAGAAPDAAPDMESMMRNAAPGLQEALRNNPEMAAMADRVRNDPSQIGQILQNPEMMSQVMNMASAFMGGAAGAPDDGDGDDGDGYSGGSYYS